MRDLKNARESEKYRIQGRPLMHKTKINKKEKLKQRNRTLKI